MKLNLFLSFLLISSFMFGQVGINTDEPNSNTLLHVSERVKNTDSDSNNLLKGILIPRLTESERDKLTYEDPSATSKVLKLFATDNSLMIYNITEDCYNYWNYLEQEWKSLCGKLGKSTFTFDCSAIVVKGTYIKGKELTSSNYLSIPVTVTKPGEYTITVTTKNGYNFTTSGTFLQVGSYSVQVTGQGTPIAVQKDNLFINANGVDISCTPTITVNVLSASGTYTLSCGSAVVNGVYKVGTILTSSNTITLPVNVTTLGSYTITSNTVNGISFSASGTFTSTGSQNITLSGLGTPSSTTKTILTLTSDSQGGVSTTCSVVVVIVIPKKIMLHIGNETIYGYSAYTGPSRQLLDSSTNFGVTTASTVKAEGYTHISLGANPSDAALLSALNNKPDIVLIGFDNSSLTTTQSQYLLDYLNKKGIVIAFQDRADSNVSLNFLRAMLSNPSLTITTGGTAGSVYPFTNVNDAVLNGSFGDIRSKYWGEDASNTVCIPLSTPGITPYSYAQPINSTTTYSGITSFRHNSLNLIWFGDGGFLSNENANGNQYTSNTIEPFVAPSSGGYKPVAKSVYGYAGNGYAAGSMQVQNSILFANVMAWALDKSEHDGINTK